MKKTCLNDAHKKHQAIMTGFAGWEMPLHYGSVLKEHHSVRNGAGVFDVSHMRTIDLKGKDSKAFLRRCLANDVQKLNSAGQALYTVMLNEQGGIIDDLIVYAIEDEYYRLVVNAGTTDKDLAWLDKQAVGYQVTFQARDDLSMLAIQGPKVFEILNRDFSEKLPNLSHLKRFHGQFFKDWFVAFTGYTGESGVEIILPSQDCEPFFEALIKSGVVPAGLASRDLLRLEAGLNLYGQDMDETQNPYTSNLAWTVDWQDSARDFIGKKSLEPIKEAGAQEVLIGLVLTQKGVLRPGMTVLDENAKEIGMLTSGSYSPICEAGIAFARVKTQAQKWFVNIRNKPVEAVKVKLPFVKSGKVNY